MEDTRQFLTLLDVLEKWKTCHWHKQWTGKICQHSAYSVHGLLWMWRLAWTDLDSKPELFSQYAYLNTPGSHLKRTDLASFQTSESSCPFTLFQQLEKAE